MKLTIVGGGGFRVPQIFEALAADQTPVTELCLYDVDAERLVTIRSVVGQLAATFAHPPRVTTSSDLDAAVRGASFVFSAMRIGGADGRIADERIALRLGVLGQETVGPGGLAFAFRTLPHARLLAERIATLAPAAWVINFTNPAGMVTEAMQQVLGDRVIGICDTPIGLVKRAAHAVGATPAEVDFDYVGLNHLGWLRRLSVAGKDRLPGLLDSDRALAGIEEARLMGFDWVRVLGALPNEYLFYYYFQREATERIRSSPETRGEFLQRQQAAFYRAAHAAPERALQLWNQTRHDRESSYMAEGRPEAERDRSESDIEGGGYQQVAVQLMRALIGDGSGSKSVPGSGPGSELGSGPGSESGLELRSELGSGSSPRPESEPESATMILNVANGDVIPELPEDAVIEVPCTVRAGTVTAHRVAPVTGDMLGLLQRVKAVEQLAIRASLTRDADLAWRAIAAHPLVDSVAVARTLLQTYREQIPAVGRAFD